MTERGRVQPGQRVVAADVGDELVLLDLETGIYYGLDSVGTRIWQLLTDGVDEALIIERLLDEYDVAPDELRIDLAALLTDLETQGLVERVAE